MTSTLTLATVVDALQISMAKDADAAQEWVRGTYLFGLALTQGMTVKAVHAELENRGETLSLTAAYGRAYAGEIALLPGFDTLPEAMQENPRKVASLCLSLYNLKGGAVALRKAVGGAADQGSAVKAIKAAALAIKTAPVVDAPTDDAPADDAPDDVPSDVKVAADLVASMAAIMSGLAKLTGTDADRAAALAVASRLAVWGGIPAQHLVTV